MLQLMELHTDTTERLNNKRFHISSIESLVWMGFGLLA